MKKFSEWVMALLFSGTLLVLMAATILLPKERYSYYENRNLSAFPEISVESVASGKAFGELETMFCDYAAWRTAALRAVTWCDLNLFHRPVVNEVVVELPYHAQFVHPQHAAYGTLKVGALPARGGHHGNGIFAALEALHIYAAPFERLEGNVELLPFLRFAAAGHTQHGKLDDLLPAGAETGGLRVQNDDIVKAVK